MDLTARVEAIDASVKFGPANMSFRGQVEVLGLEPASRTLRLAGKGTDTTGGSGASMDLTARVRCHRRLLLPSRGHQ